MFTYIYRDLLELLSKSLNGVTYSSYVEESTVVETTYSSLVGILTMFCLLWMRDKCFEMTQSRHIWYT